MTDPQAISAIVVDYFTPTHTARVVRDLAEDVAIQQILVIDNSGDPDYDIFREAGLDESQVLVLKSQRRQGYGAGVNMGAAAASGRYLLVLNSDVVLVEGRYADLRNSLTEARGLVAPTVLGPEGKVQEDAAGRLPRRWWGESVSGAWLTGAVFMVERNLFLALGGFDERFFMYWEDVDLCRRLHSLGLEVCVEPKVHVGHQSGASESSVSSRYDLASRSRVEYYKKWNFPAIQIGWVIFVGAAKRLWLRIFAAPPAGQPHTAGSASS